RGPHHRVATEDRGGGAAVRRGGVRADLRRLRAASRRGPHHRVATEDRGGGAAVRRGGVRADLRRLRAA
ncbi:hypothetical protein EDM40_15255, partial [Staphylococcus aureus]